MSRFGFSNPAPAAPIGYAPVPAQQEMPLLNPAKSGFRICRVGGISVYVDWTWLIFAVIAIQWRMGQYSSFGWNIAEFFMWIMLVVLHEFGHAVACRLIGGSVDRIVLQPLGGAAYVNPPPRPAPTLWSIAGGPLVNAALVPVLYVVNNSAVSVVPSPDLNTLLYIAQFSNKFLLVFNLLPIYPFDGGRILQCILWFFMSRARSLFIAAWVGLAGIVGLILYSISIQSIWMGIVAASALFSCVAAFKQAKLLRLKSLVPRRWDFACPACRSSPPLGPHVQCRCGALNDPFRTQCVCASCGTFDTLIPCQNCGRAIRSHEWTRLPWPPNVPPPPEYFAPAPEPSPAAMQYGYPASQFQNR